MRTFLSLALAFGVFTAMTTPQPANADQSTADHECFLDYKMKDIDGKEVDLEDYEGSVVLIVNTASRCGLTPQYAGLQDLYEKYQDKGLVVLGFPCNQFGSQEPGSESEIKTFCSTKYDVSFPMMSKIEVNGSDATPLYKQLTSTKVDPAGDGPISWNFEKFLIDREGQLVNRFSPRTKPSDEELVKAVETELAK